MYRWVRYPLVMVLALAACAPAGPRDERSLVVVTMWPLEDLAREIAGDDLQVRSLLGPGVEPHDLELDTRDLSTLAAASLVLTVGGGFQPAVDRAIAAGDLPVLDIADASEPGSDPHLWLDPKVWAGVARRVGAGLSRLVPGASDQILRRAVLAARSLEDLDMRYRTTLAGCKGATIVVMHDAFARWSRYGVRLESLLGRVPGAEPSAGSIDRLRGVIAREGVRTIFTEPGVPDRFAQTLADEFGLRIAELDPLEFSSPERLEGRMAENLRVLARGLKC